VERIMAMTKEVKQAFGTLEWEINNMKRLVENGERSPAYAMGLIRDVADKQFNILYDLEYK
jgi:hypothetical protein